MKKLFFSSILISISFLMLFSCNKKDSLDTSLVEDIKTFQAFTDESIPESDLNKIINAGINAQSAMNKQPWHFSVITNKSVMDEISNEMNENMKKMFANNDGEKKAPPPASNGPKAAIGDSPVVIVVSAKDGSEYDAGLATELMTVEATLLGYGTKLISSPTIVLNGENMNHYKSILGIPEDMKTKGVILIGKYDSKNLDAVTTASLRNSVEEVVSFIK